MPIYVSTKRSIMRTVAERWAKQYNRPPWDKDDGKQHRRDALNALNFETCSENDIESIIGHRLWMQTTCDNCGSQDIDPIVTIGEEQDYESKTARVCVQCLRDALAAAESAKPKGGE